MTIERWVRVAVLAWALGGAAAAMAAEPAAEKTRALAAKLTDPAVPVYDKARACQELGIVGTREAVPALAALLGQEPLAHYAREALEAMADPAADAALRAALGAVKGVHLVGVVNSLGMRRDAAAVPGLAKLVGESESPAAGAALLALARIGTPEATRTVRATLTTGPAILRAPAAEAALLVADELARAGRDGAAAEWYEAVRGTAGVPAQAALSALRGALLTRGSGALPLLRESLRSPDAAVRATVLRTVREMKVPEVTPALVAEREKLAPDVQAAVLGALVDLGDERARVAIERATRSPHETVRVAAWRALGRSGGPSSLPLLLAALGPGGAAAEADAVQRSLTQIQVDGADAAILAALPAAAPATQVRLIGVLGERGAAEAVTPLLTWARTADPAVSRAAWRALALLVRPADLPATIALAATLTADDVRTLADRAIYAAAMKILEPERRAEPMVRAVREATDPATRAALLRPLGAVVRAVGGNAEARALVTAAFRERNEALRTAAAKVLADWPDATVAPVLLEFLRSEPDAPQRGTVFDGAARLVAEVAAGRDRTELDAVAGFTALKTAARTDEERMKVVAGLGSLRRIEAFEMLVPMLEVAAVRTEAALAIVQIAPALLGGGQAAKVKTVLQRIADTERDADVKARAARLLRGGPPEAAKKGKKKG